MSNFKSNNRFSFLGEEKNNLEPIKSQSKISFREKEREYDNKPKYNQFKKYNSTPVPPKKEFEIKEDEFPDLLISIPIKINSNNIKSFASLLEKKDEKEEKDEDEIIPPGWCFYKYTKLKNGFTTEFIKPFINYEILEEKIDVRRKVIKSIPKIFVLTILDPNLSILKNIKENVARPVSKNSF